MKNVDIMTSSKLLKCLFHVVYGLGLVTSTLAQAQDFPRQPIKLIVPWAPGGNVDITARTIAPTMSELLGQQVVVENRAGAGGFIGSTAVVKSAPDGYTLLLGSSGSISIAPALTPTAPYNPETDLIAIGPIHAVPIVFSASAKGSMKNFADFSARVKTDKNLVSVGSAGNGSTQHLALELLAQKMNIKLNHIPYKGSGPALVDTIGGQIDTIMDQLTASISHIKTGALIPLAQTGLKRSPLLPNVPTFEEVGVKDFNMVTYTGVFGPRGMPQPIVDKLSKALKESLERPTVRERFNGLGVDIITMDRTSFQDYVRKDFNTNKEIGKSANIVIN